VPWSEYNHHWAGADSFPRPALSARLRAYRRQGWGAATGPLLFLGCRSLSAARLNPECGPRDARPFWPAVTGPTCWSIALTRFSSRFSPSSKWGVANGTPCASLAPAFVFIRMLRGRRSAAAHPHARAAARETDEVYRTEPPGPDRAAGSRSRRGALAGLPGSMIRAVPQESRHEANRRMGCGPLVWC